MRSAFGILESIFALIIFSLVILVCSQTMLRVSRDLKTYEQIRSEKIGLSNTVLYLQKAIQNSIIVDFSRHRIDYFEINRQIFFSQSFKPLIKECDSNRLLKQKDVKYFAMFSDLLEIAQILSEENGWSILDRKAKCTIVIPLKEKHQIVFEEESLYLDGRILLEGVKKFSFDRFGEFDQIEICQSSCLKKQFFRNEIVYEF